MLSICTFVFFSIIYGASGQVFTLPNNSISLSQGHKGIVLLHNAGEILPLIQSISEADAVNICHSKGYL
uniref:Uncharacterized protein n=1 Tax=Octopus bimaculoides TaxID=37653 RepID=A0A0L8I6G9_OCTBM